MRGAGCERNGVTYGLKTLVRARRVCNGGGHRRLPCKYRSWRGIWALRMSRMAQRSGTRENLYRWALCHEVYKQKARVGGGSENAFAFVSACGAARPRVQSDCEASKTTCAWRPLLHYSWSCGEPPKDSRTTKPHLTTRSPCITIARHLL